MSAHPSARSSRASKIAVAVAVALFLATGLSGAVAVSQSTDVAITPLTPVRNVTGGTSITAGKTYAFVGSDGATTVPSGARVVQLAVTVKGTKAGTLSFYPLGNPAAASPTTMSWPAGGSSSGTVKVGVGMSNKVVVENSSLAAATITLKITGYSTQVTAADLNGSGGTAGQVLTNNGNGTTAWRSQRTILKAAVLVDNYDEEAFLASGGDAISVTRTQSGQYTVSFGRTVQGCVATANPGTTRATFSDYRLSPETVMSTVADGSNVRVRAFDPRNLSYTDTSFVMSVVC